MLNLVEKTPDDILSHIFLLIVQDEVQRTPDKRPRYPWALASICTRWRKVCLEYRLLWSYINFSWHTCGLKGRVNKDSPSLKQVQLQLSRSGNAPLALIAGIMFCLCNEQRPIWKAVMAHSGRWEELDFGYFEGQEYDFARLIEEGQNTGFARLRHIAFNTSFPESDAYPSPLPGYNARLTSLRSFTAKNFSRLDGLEEFPWDQLTHLDVEPYTGFFTDLRKTLSKCKNLTHLSISIDEEIYSTEADEIPEEVEQESIVIPGLLELSLGDYDDDNVCRSIVKEILPFLQLPCLRSLTVRPVAYDDECAPYNCKYLLDFLRRSTTITELNVTLSGEETEDGIGEEEDDDSADDDGEATEARFAEYVDKLLHSAPQLQSLTFDGPLPTLISTLLQNQSNATYLCPSLQDLKVYVGLLSDSEFDWEPLVELVKSRRGIKEGLPFKTLHIIYPFRVDSHEREGNEITNGGGVYLESAWTRLNELTDDGLELRFIPLRKMPFGFGYVSLPD